MAGFNFVPNPAMIVHSFDFAAAPLITLISAVNLYPASDSWMSLNGELFVIPFHRPKGDYAGTANIILDLMKLELVSHSLHSRSQSVCRRLQMNRSRTNAIFDTIIVWN